MGAATASPSLRNVAIIAHVDHGKTTLVDAILKQSQIFAAHEHVGTLIMDSNDLERERGITILSKVTAIRYKDCVINIIDTPGHVDFGGEVERVVGMADGCLLLVDAAEGPMPQTRTVLQHALRRGLKPIIVINKIDRPNAQPAFALEATHDLLLELATSDDQLDCPVLYSNAKEGTAGTAPNSLTDSIRPILDTILDAIPAPVVDADAPLQFHVTALDHDPHRGRIAIGRIVRGRLETGMRVTRIGADGPLPPTVLSGILAFRGLSRQPITEASAGDIVAVTGISDVMIGDTIADAISPEPLPRIDVGEPSLQMQFSVNASPFAGREAKVSSTSRQIRARLERELLTNVALRVTDGPSADIFVVAGRGELHLAVLIETMRREGYEFEVSRPTVITKDIDGVKTEPYEECIVTCPQDAVGSVTQTLDSRGARLQRIDTSPTMDEVRIVYHSPTRALIGVRGTLITLTRGQATYATHLLGWEPWRKLPVPIRHGVLTASQDGVAVAYGLVGLQERGTPFIAPGESVYEGMIVGLNRRPGDIAVNVTKQKQKTNIRSSTEDFTVKLVPAQPLSLEEALAFLADDELLEVTPTSLRLRKRVLSASLRNRERKRQEAASQ